jgi:polyisoprenoid-binding protein YceI
MTNAFRTTFMTHARLSLAGIATAFALVLSQAPGLAQNAGGAQAPGAGSRQGAPGRAGAAPTPDPTRPAKLDLVEGTTARYKVREQLAGINFPSDAVGTTRSVTGTVVVMPDGSIDVSKSAITVDLKTLTSDQQMRDGFIQGRTLETEKFPTLQLVVKRAVGLPKPLPAAMQAQAGFQLVTDMTLHGVTKEVTWNVVATFGPDLVGGRATTSFEFAMFNLTKPSLARLLSVDDKIELEIEFRCKRGVL